MQNSTLFKINCYKWILQNLEILLHKKCAFWHNAYVFMKDAERKMDKQSNLIVIKDVVSVMNKNKYYEHLAYTISFNGRAT